MTVCIYHGNCADGFGAAWVVRRALGEEVKFYPGVYQNPPPDSIEGEDVVLVDFSYKRPVMEKIIEVAKSVLVLDHHKTAEEDLRDLAGAKVTFDLEHSGAMLAWLHYFPNDPPPRLLEHLEDRDLWRFKLPGTRAIQANVFSHPYDFEVWDRLMAQNPKLMETEGLAIERKHFKDIHELLQVTTRMFRIGGHYVPIANLPYIHSSDAGHIMAENWPFAGCYWDTPEGRVFSLRSRENGLDVAEIAKQYGGGGHKHASGFRVPRDHPLACH